MEQPFICPKCGSPHFGRDVAQDGTPLPTARCHGQSSTGPGTCDWHGQWPPSSVIVTSNHGSLITASTFWGSEYDRASKLFISCNAGAIRIMLPSQHRTLVNEMRGSKYAICSRGPWPEMRAAEAVELLFEDGSDSPFCLHLTAESFDLLPAEPEAGREWTLTVWTDDKGKPHKALERPCHWRRVPKIPCLKPLGES